MFAVDELKADKVAVFDDGTTGPRGLADELEKKGKDLGVEVERYVIRSGDKDCRAIPALPEGHRPHLRQPVGAGWP